MNKLPQINLIIKAIIIFIVLYTFVSLFFIKNQRQLAAQSRINLIETSPSIVYGELKKNKGFEINVDELSEAAILFNVGSFDANKFAKFNVVLKDLPLNFHAQLLWVNDQETEPHEIDLMQTSTSGEQFVLVKNNPHWKGIIKNIGLRILPQEHLGLSKNLAKPTVLIRAHLENLTFGNSYFLLAKIWSAYKPWTYRSINHLRLAEILPIYATPIIFVLLWTGLLILITFKKINVKYIAMFFFLAWFSLDVLFLKNTNLKNQWVSQEYNSDIKIHPDQALYDLSNQVKTLLNLTSNLKANKDSKVLILSTSRYQRSRLIFHMLPLNSSFLDTYIEKNVKAAIKNGDYIVSYDLPQNLIKPSHGVLKINAVSIKVKQVAKGDNFSIMKVLR